MSPAFLLVYFTSPIQSPAPLMIVGWTISHAPAGPGEGGVEL